MCPVGSPGDFAVLDLNLEIHIFILLDANCAYAIQSVG